MQIYVDADGFPNAAKDLLIRTAMRNLMTQLRDSGIMTGGPSVFGRKERQAFINQLNSFLTKNLKNNNF
jgi:uncharacterized protein